MDNSSTMVCEEISAFTALAMEFGREEDQDEFEERELEPEPEPVFDEKLNNMDKLYRVMEDVAQKMREIQSVVNHFYSIMDVLTQDDFTSILDYAIELCQSRMVLDTFLPIMLHSEICTHPRRLLLTGARKARVMELNSLAERLDGWATDY